MSAEYVADQLDKIEREHPGIRADYEAYIVDGCSCCWEYDYLERTNYVAGRAVHEWVTLRWLAGDD